jgi:hypothetical protein
MAKAEEDIKKVFVFNDQLNKVNENNKHYLRFRITTDDLSKVSSWSPFYEVNGPTLTPVSGAAAGIVSSDTLVSNSILFSWGDSNARPEYDIFVAFGRNITFRSLTNNVATIVTQSPHGFTVGDKINVEGTGAATIDGTNLTVASTPLDTSLTYAKTGTNVSNAAATAKAAVYEVVDESQGSLSAYTYHGTSPTHTYSIIKPTNINRVKFIVQTASYENGLSSTIEIYPKLGTYTESFSV